MIDTTVENIISDLTVIGKISIGDKISTSADHLDINKESFLQGLVRIYNGDSRSKALSHISNMIDYTITVVTLMMESEHLKEKQGPSYWPRYYMLRRIISAFSKSRNGIKNLMLTYHLDKLVCMQLDDLLQK